VLRAKDSNRVGIESEHDRRPAYFAGAGQEPLNDPGVPSVHTVEIADRNGTGTKVFRQVI
jgi:hypothetical protein